MYKMGIIIFLCSQKSFENKLWNIFVLSQWHYTYKKIPVREQGVNNMQYIMDEVMDTTVTKSFSKRLFNQIIKFSIMIFASGTLRHENCIEHLISVILNSSTQHYNLYEILTNIFCVNVNGSSLMVVSLFYLFIFHDPKLNSIIFWRIFLSELLDFPEIVRKLCQEKQCQLQ